MKIATTLDHIYTGHRGVISYNVADPETGAQLAVLDLVWPNGLQEELSEPVAVLLNEDAAMMSFASQAGFRCFVDGDSFRDYVMKRHL